MTRITKREVELLAPFPNEHVRVTADGDIVLTAYGTGSPPIPGCDCIYVIRKLPVSFDN